MEDQDLTPEYRVERSGQASANWRVIGPNGPVADYPTEQEAQMRADDLNEQVAEERENDA